MAFPVVAAVNGGNEDSASTNHTVNLPADISADDLLLVFFVADGDPTITFPEGWTQLFQTAREDNVKFGAWYRIADGEEGATIAVTLSASEETAHTSYRITGYEGTPEVGTSAIGSSTTPDPPSLSPTWGAEDTLWIACEGNDYGTVVTGYPTNFTDERSDKTTGAGSVGCASARRELNAESEDPGTFTLTDSEPWVANVVAISPVTVVTHEWEGSDGIAIGEALVKTPMKMLVDGIQLSDITIKEFYKTLTDPIAFTDVIVSVKTIFRTFVDGIAFTDIVHRLFDKVFSDGIKFTDCLTRWRWVTAVRNLVRRRCNQPSVREQDSVDDGNI